MVLIQVKKKDASKVFGILIQNGRFAEFKGNIFRIDENEQKILEKIERKKIPIKKL